MLLHHPGEHIVQALHTRGGCSALRHLVVDTSLVDVSSNVDVPQPEAVPLVTQRCDADVRAARPLFEMGVGREVDVKVRVDVYLEVEVMRSSYTWYNPIDSDPEPLSKSRAGHMPWHMPLSVVKFTVVELSE